MPEPSLYYPSPIKNTPIRIPPPFPYGSVNSSAQNSSRTRQNILNLINAQEQKLGEFDKSIVHAHNLNQSWDGNNNGDEFHTVNFNSLSRSSGVGGHTSSLTRSLSSRDETYGLPLVTGGVVQRSVTMPSGTARGSIEINRRLEQVEADEGMEHDQQYITSTVARNWEYVNVSLTRVPGYGFGIAVSGGCDNPHFANGDPAIAISDVLKGGPAMGKLQINDRIVSANGISLDNVDYSTAVQILRDSGPCVNLRVKRRVNPQSYKVTVPLNTKRLKKLSFESLGFTVSVTLQIKTVENPALGVREGDLIDKIHGLKVNELFNEKTVCKEIRRVLEETNQNGNSTNLNLTVKRSGGGNRNVSTVPQATNSLHQPSHSVGNLYVQPPTRANNKSFDSTNTPLPPPPVQNVVAPPPPPRPPLPQEFDQPRPPLRSINFIKQNQLGIRLSGGNKTGIIVSAVQKNSQADLQGLTTHDKIIRVNEHDFVGNPPTREQAIEILSSIPNDTLVNLTVEKVGALCNVDNQDEFYVRTRVAGDDFKLHEVLVVTDTLVNGLVGHWEAWKLDHHGNRTEKIIIPNMKNGKELLKKTWKRTHSFRNREFEELLQVAVATDAYEVVERRNVDICTRPVILFTPVNSTLVDAIMSLKHASRLFKVVGKTDELDFNDARVRIVTEVVAVKIVQEMYSKGVFPYVVFGNFQSKEAMKDALKDSSKYSKAKRLYSVLQKVRDKLGSYVDMEISLRDIDNGAEVVYDSLVQARGHVFYAPLVSQATSTPTTTPSKRSHSQPRTPSGHKEDARPLHRTQSSHHSRNKSTDSLAPVITTATTPTSNFRTPTSPSPASMNSLKFPNFNIPPPCSIIEPPSAMETTYEKRVLVHRSTTNVGPVIPEPRSDTRTTNHPTTPTSLHNNFAHSPVLERRDNPQQNYINGHDRIRAQSNPPPGRHSGNNGNSGPVPPPTIDRTKKPSSSNANVFYPASMPLSNSPAGNFATPPKPKPPPKPRIIPNHHGKSIDVNRSLFRPVSNTSKPDTQDNDNDTGQTYLNIPMNSKGLQQVAREREFIQQQQQQSNVTSGVFDWRGGRLVQAHVFGNQIPIEVFIPERAIPHGETVTVWFQIVDYNVREDTGNPAAGKKMLSPLVKFGPENYRFQIPVEIRIPQYSANSSGNDSNHMLAQVLMNNQADYWTKIDIQNGNYPGEFGEQVKVVSLTVQQF